MGILFQSLGFNLLPTSALKRLSLYILRHPEKATKHISSVSKEYDGLSHHWPALGVILPEIERLRTCLCVKFEPMIAYMQPATNLEPHRDGLNGGRRSSLVQPLHPTEGYSSTFFWADGIEHELKRSDLPALIDLQALHSVNNIGEVPRFNFQLSLDLAFEEAQQLHQAGKLFRSIPFQL